MITMYYILTINTKLDYPYLYKLVSQVRNNHKLFRTSFKASTKVSTFWWLKTIGGLIFSTLPWTPSRLTNMFFYRSAMIIRLAVVPSYFFEVLSVTISIPWKNPIPRMSPTQANSNISSLSLRFRCLPISCAFSGNFNHSITSMTAQVAVTAIGFPPKVLKNYISRCL